MNPYLWLMCNEVEEGSRLPSLMSLKEIESSETSMEVVLVDKRGDRRLKELEEKAQELYCASENTLVLAEKLGQLVAIYMGGTFPVEQGDLHRGWKLPCQLSLKKQVIDKLPTVLLDEELRIKDSQIYKVHDEAKDKAFELEMSWVCDESKQQHHKEPSFTARVNYQTEANYLKSLPGYPVE
ncbi:Armadillo repeat-containing protein 3 and Serine/threonine-protein kinase CTR1 [Corchorus capsularis]|uniref:Armadillo repeat-containing protein 3 and Serine/threonine-protein kinase CTR1 n=1 Tax=Corchorus capsularis TaxID=210143 RepID=A0A1R3JVL9_COCAP|nr:Armadillo repeat-containing protein 3 and Serine/threonine-protein kinase CTR1 [Corchorus capsularis]